MSVEVDERVVSMQFDNKQFEKNVGQSINSLKNLNETLKMKGATTGLQNVQEASRNTTLSPLANAADEVVGKFRALEVMAITALANITNKAVNAGLQIAKAFTIDPIATGFKEYETQINSVQTILANTESKGTTLDQVNAALDELNEYADMTIYNFTEMTRNIGTFTAAGVDLDTSVAAIKGIANLAAVSGSNSHQASVAMYQLSQALSSGTVKLQDWNSVVNAGMGGQVFQDALKETARVHGIAIDDMIESEGSFRNTLQEGWLTSEILTETLSKFTGDLSKEQLAQKGYTEEQIKEILKLGETANDAATKVKTFTQLMDTLKEAAQSGWTQTWELLVGDFEEAKRLWTSVSDVFSKIIGDSAEARNSMVKEWIELGGRNDVLKSFENIFKAITALLKPIGEAFEDVFPSEENANKLYKITKAIESFTSKLIINEDVANALRDTFKGLFAAIDIVATIVGRVASGVVKLFGNVAKLGGEIIGVTGSFGDFISNLRDVVKESTLLTRIMSGLSAAINVVLSGISSVIKFVREKFAAPGLEWLSTLLKGIGDVLSWIGEKVVSVAQKLGTAFSDSLQNGGLQNLVEVANTGIFGAILYAIFDFIQGLGDSMTVLAEFKEVVAAWKHGGYAFVLQMIAKSILMLAAALILISMVDKDKLVDSLMAIGVMLGELLATLALFSKVSGLKNIAKSISVFTALSTAVLTLSVALKIISTISQEKLTSALIGLTAVLGALLGSLAVMSKIGATKDIKSSAKAIQTLATSLVIIAVALKIVATMSWEEIGKGLVGVTGALLVMVGILAVMKVITKNGKPGDLVVAAFAIQILAGSLILIGAALKIVGSMSWDQIDVALTGVLAVLVTLAIVMAAFSLLGNAGQMAAGAAAILIVSYALINIAGALALVGLMPWDGIAKGLLGLLVVLGVMTAVLFVLSPVAVQAVVAAAALLVLSLSMMVVAQATLVLAGALALMSTLPLGEVALGLLAISGALLVLGVASLLSPALLVMSIAMLALAAATVMLGAGLLAISTGITALAATGTVVITSFINNLKILLEGLLTMIPSLMTSLTNALTTLMTALAAAIGKAAPKLIEAVFVLVDTLLEKIVEYVPKFVKMGVDLILALLEGIADALPKIVSVASDIVINFINAISENNRKFVQAGFDMILNFLDGLITAIDTNIPKIKAKMEELFLSIITGGNTELKKGITSFTNIGKDLMAGLRNGITNGLSAVSNAIKSGAQRVAGWFAEKLGIHSPSTVFAGFGENINEGLVVGLNKNVNDVNKAVDGVGNTAMSGMTKAVSSIMDAFNTDVDSQPTIRPVVDLSNVQAGADSINGMFGVNPSVGVLSNVNDISRSMNGSQNGDYDILTAIESLGAKIGSQAQNVYNINGITYEEGSEVAAAIQTLVRASIIERRI